MLQRGIESQFVKRMSQTRSGKQRQVWDETFNDLDTKHGIAGCSTLVRDTHWCMAHIYVWHALAKTGSSAGCEEVTCEVYQWKRGKRMLSSLEQEATQTGCLVLPSVIWPFILFDQSPIWLEGQWTRQKYKDKKKTVELTKGSFSFFPFSCHIRWDEITEDAL